MIHKIYKIYNTAMTTTLLRYRDKVSAYHICDKLNQHKLDGKYIVKVEDTTRYTRIFPYILIVYKRGGFYRIKDTTTLQELVEGDSLSICIRYAQLETYLANFEQINQTVNVYANMGLDNFHLACIVNDALQPYFTSTIRP